MAVGVTLLQPTPPARFYSRSRARGRGKRRENEISESGGGEREQRLAERVIMGLSAGAIGCNGLSARESADHSRHCNSPPILSPSSDGRIGERAEQE